MIRKLKTADISAVADIWLNANLDAHDFIPAQYWKDNFEGVKEQLAQAEVYVYENAQGIQGFIGLNGGHIEGIFVRREARSGGAGRQLLDFAKSVREQLTLGVYQKNARALRFYQREGFALQCENADENTGEKEYRMIWERRA